MNKNRNNLSRILRKNRPIITILVIFGISFGLGIFTGKTLDNVKDTSYNEDEQTVETSVVSYSLDEEGLLPDYVESPLDTQLMQEELNEIEEVDVTQLTKSKIVSRRDELSVFLSYFETFGISVENELYKNLKAEYDKCVEALETNNYLYPYSDYDYRLLAEVIMREQGDSRSPDEAQMLVGCVVLNRVANGGIGGRLENPTIMDVLLEPGQYPHPDWEIDDGRITDQVWENTRKVLEHEYEAPADVLYQALFPQGSGIYKSFYNEGYGSTTYFCYGRLATE